MTNETQTAAPVSLEALIARWRRDAETWRIAHDRSASHPCPYDACANQLEATLRLAQSGEVAPDGYTSFGEFRWAADCTDEMRATWLPLFTHPAAVDEAMVDRALKAYGRVGADGPCDMRDFARHVGNMRAALTAALQPAPSENES